MGVGFLYEFGDFTQRNFWVTLQLNQGMMEKNIILSGSVSPMMPPNINKPGLIKVLFAA